MLLIFFIFLSLFEQAADNCNNNNLTNHQEIERIPTLKQLAYNYIYTKALADNHETATVFNNKETSNAIAHHINIETFSEAQNSKDFFKFNSTKNFTDLFKSIDDKELILSILKKCYTHETSQTGKTIAFAHYLGGLYKDKGIMGFFGPKMGITIRLLSQKNFELRLTTNSFKHFFSMALNDRYLLYLDDLNTPNSSLVIYEILPQSKKIVRIPKPKHSALHIHPTQAIGFHDTSSITLYNLENAQQIHHFDLEYIHIANPLRTVLDKHLLLHGASISRGKGQLIDLNSLNCSPIHSPFNEESGKHAYKLLAYNFDATMSFWQHITPGMNELIVFDNNQQIAISKMPYDQKNGYTFTKIINDHCLLSNDKGHICWNYKKNTFYPIEFENDIDICAFYNAKTGNKQGIVSIFDKDQIILDAITKHNNAIQE